MWITAHAGCEGTAPNSMENLLCAFSGGADVVEVDVRQSGGVLVLSHNEPAGVPVPFSRALSLLAAHPDKKLNCDLKTAGLEQAVYDAAGSFGVANRLIYTGEVDRTLFSLTEEALPGVSWYANINNFVPGLEENIEALPPQEAKKALLSVLDQIGATRAAGLNWQYRHALWVWEEARERGVGISVWTVDDPEDLRSLLALHPDNLTTNRVRLALSLRNPSGSPGKSS